MGIRGSPLKQQTTQEIKTGHIQSFRRSLFFKSDLPKGHQIRIDDLDALRPAIGISPKEISKFIGKKLKIDVAKGEALNEGHV